MTRSPEEAEEWAARFNEHVPPGKDLRYEFRERKPGKWSVIATHPQRDAEYREPLPDRVALVAAGIAGVVFWGAVIGGCGYVIATSDWSGSGTATRSGGCSANYEGACLDPNA